MMNKAIITYVLFSMLIGVSCSVLGQHRVLEELSIEQLQDGIEQRQGSRKIEYMTELSSRYVRVRSVSQGLAITLQALNESKKLPDTTSLATLNNNAGFFYSLSHAYEDAVRYFLLGLAQAKKENDLFQMSISYTGLGLVELKAKKFDTSIDYIRQSLELAELINSKERIVASKSNLASARLRRIEYQLEWRGHQINSLELDSAQRKILERLSQDYGEFMNSVSIGAIYYNHGLVNNHLGNISIATESLLQAVELFKQGSSDDGLIHSYVELARNAYLKKDFALALSYIQLADAVTLSGQQTRLKLERLKFQPVILLANGQTKLARQAFSKYKFLSERNTDETAKLRVDATVRLDDIRYQKQKISQLSLERKLDQAALSKERFLRNAQWSGIVVLFILLALLYWLWRTRVKSSEIIGAYNKVLESQALQDGLTGILNRRAFEEDLSKEHHLFRRNNNVYALAMIDIDNFKLVNDNYGHTVGDEVLKKFAAMIKAVCRKEDIACRWGGEEFMMLFRHTDKAQATSIVERLLEDFSQLDWAHLPYGESITFSAGVVDSASNLDLNGLLLAVDEALYQGKDNGRACVVAT